MEYGRKNNPKATASILGDDIGGILLCGLVTHFVIST